MEIKEGAIAIGTSIPREVFDEIHAKGLHYNELIIRGLQASKGMPALMGRVGELESGNEKLQAKLSQECVENFKLQERVKALETQLTILQTTVQVKSASEEKKEV